MRQFFVDIYKEMATILDDSILYESVGGVKVDETGSWAF